MHHFRIFAFCLAMIATQDILHGEESSYTSSQEEIAPAPLISLSGNSLIGLDPTNQKQLQNRPSENDNIEQALQKKSIPTFWIALAVILCTIIMLLRWIMPWIRTKIKRTFAPTPHIKASRALQKLDRVSLMETKDFTNFYSRTSFIVRRFLEDQFQLKATALTTQEFLDQLIAQPIFKKEMQHRLQQFLQHADLVKFADHTPSLEECREVQQTAQELVNDCTTTSINQEEYS